MTSRRSSASEFLVVISIPTLYIQHFDVVSLDVLLYYVNNVFLPLTITRAVHAQGGQEGLDVLRPASGLPAAAVPVQLPKPQRRPAAALQGRDGQGGAAGRRIPAAHPIHRRHGLIRSGIEVL